MTRTPTMLYRNATLVTCAGPPAKSHDPDALLRELAIVQRGYLVVERGQIVAMGEGEAPVSARTQAIDCGGRLITPALVDCHTHMLFAGSRIRDFRDKMAGVSYQEIAARGGGIQSTVRATHAAGDDDLASALLQRAIRESVAVVEVKTGYGGDIENELRLLRVLLTVGQDKRSVDIVPTWLGLHGPPVGDREAYLFAHAEVLPSVHALFSAANREPVVDVYLDENAYSLAECERYLKAAKQLGFAIRGHIGQFRDLGGAELLSSFGARSCDHLEQVSDRGLAAMAKSETLAVLLPGAWRTLRQVAPDAARIAANGVRIAVATDYNPGTSPIADLQLCAALAVRDAGLHPDAALLSITRRAAEALGVDAGVLRVRADKSEAAQYALWDTDEVAAFAYHLGTLPRWVA